MLLLPASHILLIFYKGKKATNKIYFHYGVSACKIRKQLFSAQDQGHWMQQVANLNTTNYYPSPRYSESKTSNLHMANKYCPDTWPVLGRTPKDSPLSLMVRRAIHWFAQLQPFIFSFRPSASGSSYAFLNGRRKLKKTKRKVKDSLVLDIFL